MLPCLAPDEAILLGIYNTAWLFFSWIKFSWGGWWADYIVQHMIIVLIASTSSVGLDQPAQMHSFTRAISCITKYGSRGRLRPNIRPLAQNGFSNEAFVHMQ